MKVFTALAALTLAVVANAQAPTLPDCAQTCASKFLAGGIGNCGSDPKCICSDQQFLGEIACCLAQPGGCNEADQKQAVNFAIQFCQAQDVSVPTAVSCASTATQTTTSPGGATTGASNGTVSTPTPTAGGVSTSTRTGGVPRATGAAAAGVLGGLVAAVALL